MVTVRIRERTTVVVSERFPTTERTEGERRSDNFLVQIFWQGSMSEPQASEEDPAKKGAR